MLGSRRRRAAAATLFNDQAIIYYYCLMNELNVIFFKFEDLFLTGCTKTRLIVPEISCCLWIVCFCFGFFRVCALSSVFYGLILFFFRSEHNREER